MAVEPTTILNLPMQALRDLIAACPAFQSWTGTGGYASAKGRIHYFGMTSPATANKPYAVLSVPEEDLAEWDLHGEPNSFTHSGELVVLFYAELGAEATVPDQLMTIENSIGAIIEQMIAKRGETESGDALLVFNGLSAARIQLAHEDEKASRARYVEGEFRVFYGAYSA